MTERYDAAVVGAGLAGASAALGLAAAGKKVALLERDAPEPQTGRLGFDTRTVALNPVSKAMLDGFGVGESLRAQPIVRMHVWEESGTASIDFDAASIDELALAWVVESGAATAALFERCQTAVDVMTPVAVDGMEMAADHVSLVCGGAVVEAQLVIAADGGRSKIRSLCGSEVTELSDANQALVTVARMERAHDGTAYQVFRGGARCSEATGPLALLPLADPHVVSVIWSLHEEQASALPLDDDTAFCELLSRASEHVLGDVEAVDARATFPVAQTLASDFNPAPRIVLVGDAAHTVHPLAGQGANLGFEDVAAVSRTAARAGADLGAPGLWRRYARTRWARAMAMMRLMTFFQRTYSMDDAAPRWLRNVGVRFVDAAPGIKRQLIREAMGVGPIARRL